MILITSDFDECYSISNKNLESKDIQQKVMHLLFALLKQNKDVEFSLIDNETLNCLPFEVTEIT